MSLRAVTQDVDDGKNRAAADIKGKRGITADTLSGARSQETGVLYRRAHDDNHLRASTRVPSPGADANSKSSIMRRTAGSPMPSVPLELK